MPGAPQLDIFTLAQRPELRPRIFSAEFAAAVPEFMRHDPTAELYYASPHLDRYLGFALAALDRDEPDRVVARAMSVPFAFRDGTAGREELPDSGWDEIIRWAHQDAITGRKPNAISALEIMVVGPYRGRGVSGLMLAAMRENAKRLGFTDLYAPVRPSDKHREPRTSFAEYVHRTRGDGLPHDSWLRVHARVGGTIVKVAPCSMVIAGTLAEWSHWTGLPFATSGEIEVAGALSPVHVNLAQDHAVYVEPNVWVHHRV
jgi:GNAT superfamily N-acetyltransferase